MTASKTFPPSLKLLTPSSERGKLGLSLLILRALAPSLVALQAIQVTVEGKQVIGVGQGYQMMNAIKTTERMLANGTLWHSKSSLMNWAVGNVAIEHMATSIRPTKAERRRRQDRSGVRALGCGVVCCRQWRRRRRII